MSLSSVKEFLIKAAIALASVLAPIKTVLIATGALIFIDLISGVIRAMKMKEEISSSVMRRTVTKVVVYNLAIISGFILETYMMPDVPATKLISSVIGLVEAKSILENLNGIYGADIFKSLLQKLGSDNDPKV